MGGKSTVAVGLCLMMAGWASSSVLMCYVTSWSQYRVGGGKFTSDKLDSSLCTHLVFAFASMTDNSLREADTQDIIYYKEMNELKLINPCLKTLLALGGANFPSYLFREMIRTSSSRAKFIQSTVQFLRLHKFDGLNLNWEFPSAYEKDLFTALVKETHAAYVNEGIMTNRPRLLFTAAVPAYTGNMAGFDIPQISKYLDHMNVMSYDFYNLLDGFTRHHSPLFAGPLDFGNLPFFTANYSMSIWRDSGAPSEKLLMGIATYGRTFTLASASNNDVGDSVTTVGPPGLYTGEGGFWSYYEVCHYIPSAERRWYPEQKVPYGSAGTTWIGYDDVASAEEKAKVIKQYNYGGAAVWAIDLDDFGGGFCGQGKFPITRRLHQELVTDSGCTNPGTPPTTTATTTNPGPTTTTTTTTNPGPTTTTTTTNPGPTTTTTTTTNPGPTTTTTTTTNPNPENTIDTQFCKFKASGLYPISGHPHKYYQCFMGNTYVMDCPATLVWDIACKCCNWP